MANPLPKERDVFIKNYAKLTSAVRDIDNLLPHFVSARIINQDDMDEIKAVPRTTERVTKLLKFISGPLDAGFTKSYTKLLDIMYHHGNDATRDLAIAMGRKDDASSTNSSPITTTSPTEQNGQHHSSSFNGATNVANPTGSSSFIKSEIVFNDKSGKGIFEDCTFNEKKKAVCRIHGTQMTGTGFVGYLGVGGAYFTALVTNHHVIPTIDDAMGSRIEFENAFSNGQSCMVKLCDAIAKDTTNFWSSTEENLDFSIVKLADGSLKDVNTNQLLDINPINLSRPADIKNSDQIFIIQYPHGGNLSFSASPGYVLGPLLLYKSGTKSGSSGSPVLKEVNGELVPVALHRGSDQNSQLCNYGTLFSEILKCTSGQRYLQLPTVAEVHSVLAANQ